MEGNLLQGIFGILLMIVYVFASVYIPKLKLTLVHQTGIAVVLGFLSGVIVKKVTFTQVSGDFIVFDEDLFFYYLLPPIIFAEGFNMKRQRFFQNAGYVSLFGILGTIICFIVNALCSYYFSEWGVIKDVDGNDVRLTIKDVFLLGSVLSASDTVAAISVITEEEAPVARAILLGEGVVNDAVAIILFQSAIRMEISSLDAGTVGQYILDIAYICVTSVLVGAVFGMLSAAMTRRFAEFNNHPPYEVALLFFLAYLGYMVSFALDISGVICILTTAIMMGHYTWYNISEEARHVSRGVFHIMGDVIEAFVFVYIGLTSYEYYDHFGTVLFMGEYTLVVMLGRFAGIVFMPGLLKLVWRRFSLGWTELIAIWFAGSIRGAIAFALILTVQSSDNKEVLKTTILGIVIFTTIVLGSIMPVVKTLVVKTIREQYIDTSLVQSILHKSRVDSHPLLPDRPSQPEAPQRPRSKLHQRWRYVDDHFIKRFLIRKEAIEERKLKEQQAFKLHAAVQTDDVARVD